MREGKRKAFLLNGDESIEIPRVIESTPNDEWMFEFPHYDSRILARAIEQGSKLSGEWIKRSGPSRWTRLAFEATDEGACDEPGAGIPEPERSRWCAHFDSSTDAAVLLLERRRNVVQGTFLTTTGDYRYLSGLSDAQGFVLQCFDGAHAFLIDARTRADGTLDGDFWSGDSWHETWTAKLDPNAKLPDPFELTKSNADAKLADLKFPGLDGKVRSLDEDDLKGHARIIQVFGSWCPNCNDEAPFLAELDARYRERGLRIVGLAFELTDDFARDAHQVELFRDRYRIRYPLLVAGLSDKDKASQALPLLDKLRAYPTTIFVKKDGSVRAVHQGYSGPATGVEHEKLREDFERLIDELLAEPAK